jgi:HEAT repeat protein
MMPRTTAACCLVAALLLAPVSAAADDPDSIHRPFTVRKPRPTFAEITDRAAKELDLRVSAPTPAVEGRRFELTPGTRPVRDVLQQLARSADLEVEFVEHDNETVAAFWTRPDSPDWPRLKELAASGDETGRCVAARWLPTLGSKRALALAVSLLGDRSPRVRTYARFELAATCRTDYLGWSISPLALLLDEEAVRGITQDLDAKTPVSKYVLLRLLWSCRDPKAVPLLAKMLDPLYEIDERQQKQPKTPAYMDVSKLSYICEALARIGGAEAEKTLFGALGRLHGPNRQYVIRAIGLLSSQKATRTLVELLKNNHRYNRREALFALGRPAHRAAVPAVLNLLNDKKTPEHLRPSICIVLARIGSPDAQKAAISLMRAEKEPRRQAGMCLNVTRLPGVAASLAKLVDAKDAHVATAATTALGLTRDPAAVPMLVPLLTHETKDVRRRAALSLGLIGGEPAVAALLEALKKGDLDLKCSAAQALRDAGAPAAAPALCGALKAADARLRALAARALARCGGPAEIAPLLALADRPRDGRLDPYGGRADAIRSLGLIGGKRSARELKAKLDVGRLEAAEALLFSQDGHCRAAARGLLTGDDAGLKRALMFALDARTSRLRRLPPVAFHAAEALIADLNSSEETQRVEAARRLRRVNEPRAVAPLLERALTDKAEKVRLHALLALAPYLNSGDRMIDPACAEGVVAVLKSDRSKLVRRQAVSLVGQLGLADRPDIAELLESGH